MASQSRTPTGFLTGTERWEGRGDAIFRGQQERKAAARERSEPKPKGLLEKVFGPDRVARIKTGDAHGK